MTEKFTAEHIRLEQDATRLAGDVSVLRAIEKQHPKLKFLKFFDISKKHSTSAFPDASTTPYDNPRHFDLPYKVSKLKFFRHVVLPRLSSHIFQFERDDTNKFREDMNNTRHECRAIYAPDLELTVENNPLLTPREDVAGLAHLHASDIRLDSEMTSAQMAAFTMRHEAQHKRSYETWQDPARKMVGSDSPPALARGDAGYMSLWQKTSQAKDIKEPYIKFIAENMSDVAGALGHLKDGGGAHFNHTISDARAHGFYVSGESYKYGTHPVLDYIAENADTLKKRMTGMNEKEVESLTAELVGQHAMDREMYHEQVLLNYANELAAEQDVHFLCVDYADRLADKNSGLKQVWEAYNQGREGKSGKPWYSATPDITEVVHKASEAQVPRIVSRLQEGYDGLTSGPELTEEQRKAEVYGVIKYVQQTHPQFADARGARELLHRREIVTRSLYRNNEIYKETAVLEDLKSHINAQVEKQNNLELTQTQTIGQLGR